MKVQLKRVVRLGDKKYVKGMHEIPEAHCQGWYFDALKKDGDAIVHDASPVLPEAKEAPYELPVVESKEESEPEVKKKKKKE